MSTESRVLNLPSNLMKRHPQQTTLAILIPGHCIGYVMRHVKMDIH